MSKDDKGILADLTLEELVDYVDTHDMGDYWEQMPEEHFDFRIGTRQHLIPMDEELIDKVAEIAKSKHTSAEKLINSWVEEKVGAHG